MPCRIPTLFLLFVRLLLMDAAFWCTDLGTARRSHAVLQRFPPSFIFVAITGNARRPRRRLAFLSLLTDGSVEELQSDAQFLASQDG